MTGIPTPEAVEVMTHRFDRLLDRAQQAQALHHTWINVRVDDLTGLLARALPAPRRYTGGPLEDGLYLCRPAPHWFVGTNGWWLVDPNTRDGKDELSDIVETSFDVWLIGPIHIPPIPEGEEASS